MLFAAVHESGFGTFEPRADVPSTTALEGKPECAGRPAGSRWCKSITMKK
jgi:hypothetical protein